MAPVPFLEVSTSTTEASTGSEWSRRVLLKPCLSSGERELLFYSIRECLLFSVQEDVESSYKFLIETG